MPNPAKTLPSVDCASTPDGRDSVMEENTQTQKAVRSRFRLDLAGRLFRPRLIFFRAARSKTRPQKAVAGLRSSADPTNTCQDPVDIICAGMYRACSTWQYEVVAHLIEEYYDGQ